jgi:hypothetical protein
MAVQLRRVDEVRGTSLVSTRTRRAASTAVELIARCFAIGAAIGLVLESGAHEGPASVALMGIVALAAALLSWDP